VDHEHQPASYNHFKAITNLYAKGMRTLVAPNAVNIMLARSSI